jgi:hypothetical protein
MIIFNHNLIFFDEPDLNDDTFDPKLKTVTISEKSNLSDLYRYVETSSWIELSGQEARYHSTIPFDRSLRSFSWALEIKDVVTIAWDSDLRMIRYHRGVYYSPTRLRFWIFHTFFPMVLELEEIYHILHVGSIEIDERAILLSAPSFGGKSTLTDYFVKQGHNMLSDDSLAIEKIDDSYCAISSYPFSRPYRELETLGDRVDSFATSPKPIESIYLLNKAEPLSEIKIVKLKGIDKFKLFNYSHFINFSYMQKERFLFFSKMSQEISAYRVVVPWCIDRIDDVYRKIVSNSNSINR